MNKKITTIFSILGFLLLLLYIFLGKSPSLYTGEIYEEYRGKIIEKKFNKVWHYKLITKNGTEDFAPTCGVSLEIGDIVYKPAGKNYFYISNKNNSKKNPFLYISKEQYKGNRWPEKLNIEFVECESIK